MYYIDYNLHIFLCTWWFTVDVFHMWIFELLDKGLSVLSVKLCIQLMQKIAVFGMSFCVVWFKTIEKGKCGIYTGCFSYVNVWVTGWKFVGFAYYVCEEEINSLRKVVVCVLRQWKKKSYLLVMCYILFTSYRNRDNKSGRCQSSNETWQHQQRYVCTCTCLKIE